MLLKKNVGRSIIKDKFLLDTNLIQMQRTYSQNTSMSYKWTVGYFVIALLDKVRWTNLCTICYFLTATSEKERKSAEHSENAPIGTKNKKKGWHLDY